MFINTYRDNSEFNHTTQNYPTLFKLGFVRDEFGLKRWNYEWILSIDIDDLDADGIAVQILRALPLIGTVMGLSRIYSVWSTDTFDDNLKDKIIHTLAGLIETCGLGLITLIMKVFYNIFAHIIFAITASCVRLCKGIEKEEEVRELLGNIFACGN
ncbi:hypothetical protein [Chlamydia caviae]|uniref:Uncharacterized protein n=1 Tax=Chlamydia caviae (strain ATCC VR-813 / DSM 19441 / 03DC25 / GPIC) TaxID=227941 RepID=Q822U6_CHLCV|nr:hypothetical protein [Chlamydia caviae]AAP05325.1 conserved hypothetical protein [Chlamydia caviae GPIC]